MSVYIAIAIFFSSSHTFFLFFFYFAACFFSFVCRQWDELKELYEQIHSTTDELLLQQYEDLIKALVAESKEHRMESEQLETSLRR